MFTHENNSSTCYIHLLKLILGKSRMKGGVLPAYCDPPNPCPAGYTAEDGCIQMEEFENKAEFSRKYQVRGSDDDNIDDDYDDMMMMLQASQNCMCDSEHMFSCPDINSFDPVYKERQVTLTMVVIDIYYLCLP